MDLRTVFDHASIVYREETLHRGMRPLTEVKQFADQASDVIGNMTWTWGHQPTGGPEQYLNYRFAIIRHSGIWDVCRLFGLPRIPRITNSLAATATLAGISQP